MVVFATYDLIISSWLIKGRLLSSNSDSPYSRPPCLVASMVLSRVRLNTCRFSSYGYLLAVLTIWFGVALASRKSVGRGYAAVLMFIPALLGSLLVNALPSQNKIGLLFSYWVTSEIFETHCWCGTLSDGDISYYSFHICAVCNPSRMGWLHRLGTYEKYVEILAPSNGI